MDKKGAVLAFDTSNYTTSIALMDESGALLDHQRKLLSVPTGKRGLRQSDALFQHVRELPGLMDRMRGSLKQVAVSAVGYSSRPRRVEGSYMPVFLAGESLARSLAVTHQAACMAFSHQEGHIAAGLWSLGLEVNDPFYALQLSGGTTELLRVDPAPDGGYRSAIIMDTSDLSLGQLIDRTGVALGLAFPAGPALEQLALGCQEKPFDIPFSITHNQISLSGPETFVQRKIGQGVSPALIALSVFRFSGHLLGKIIIQAAKKEALPVLLTVGGVAANAIIRDQLAAFTASLPLTVHHALPEFCSDNAVGIAALTQQGRRR